MFPWSPEITLNQRIRCKHRTPHTCVGTDSTRLAHTIVDSQPVVIHSAPRVPRENTYLGIITYQGKVHKSHFKVFSTCTHLLMHFKAITAYQQVREYRLDTAFQTFSAILVWNVVSLRVWFRYVQILVEYLYIHTYTHTYIYTYIYLYIYIYSIH